MEKALTIYKNLGETPLEALERTRLEQGIAPDMPMTYAGRLDPMAEGLMHILVGEECKNKAAYTGLSKTYEFEMLTGVSTDTYDLLGIVTETDFEKKVLTDEIYTYLTECTKTFSQNYPPYSSKTFEGKQLHTHAREGSIPEVRHEVTLSDFESLGEQFISYEELLGTIVESINLVHGDFRQEEITSKWDEVLKNYSKTKFHITKWEVSVSSGFYIRQLVHDIGESLGVPMVTFHIKRTKIG